jgi:hypothetical protein
MKIEAELELRKKIERWIDERVEAGILKIVSWLFFSVYDATEKLPAEQKNPYFDYELDKKKFCFNFTEEEYIEFCKFAGLWGKNDI